MKQGTKSVLFGDHSIIHSYLVWRSWKILFGKYPTFKQTICILLHDIGYFGTDYNTLRTNSGHAELGAYIAGRLFGAEYAKFVLGHSSKAIEEFNIPESLLVIPDEYSWLIAPMWWMRWNKWIQPWLNDPEDWITAVRENFYGPIKLPTTELGFKLHDNKIHK